MRQVPHCVELSLGVSDASLPREFVKHLVYVCVCVCVCVCVRACVCACACTNGREEVAWVRWFKRASWRALQVVSTRELPPNHRLLHADVHQQTHALHTRARLIAHLCGETLLAFVNGFHFVNLGECARRQQLDKLELSSEWVGGCM
jgi:hypothetical protein